MTFLEILFLGLLLAACVGFIVQTVRLQATRAALDDLLTFDLKNVANRFVDAVSTPFDPEAVEPQSNSLTPEAAEAEVESMEEPPAPEPPSTLRPYQLRVLEEAKQLKRNINLLDTFVRAKYEELEALGDQAERFQELDLLEIQLHAMRAYLAALHARRRFWKQQEN